MTTDEIAYRISELETKTNVLIERLNKSRKDTINLENKLKKSEKRIKELEDFRKKYKKRFIYGGVLDKMPINPSGFSNGAIKPTSNRISELEKSI